MIIWLTGRSGSGKSVYAEFLYREHGFLIIDGDEMRASLSADLKHTYEDRVEQGRRMIALCKMFERQTNIVISTPLAQNHGRQRVYSEIPMARIVWINASLDECKRRDPKGLYAAQEKKMQKESPWEDPERYDAMIDTEKLTIEDGQTYLSKFVELWRNQ